MGKSLKKIYKFVVFLMVVLLWLFSLYRIVSHFGLINRFSGLIRPATATGSVCFSCPPEPPNPPFPPCPSCCQPTPTPTFGQPTPTPTIEITPSPTQPPTPTPTPILEITPTLAPSPSPLPPNDNGGGGGGSSSPPVCGSPTPQAPQLLTLVVMGNGQVKLQWNSVENASHYSIVYGPNSGNYIYGVADTGNTTSFTVGSLGNGNYCFAIRAINDCAPSPLSNEKCINDVLGTGIGGAVLGAKTPKVLAATGNTLDNFLIPVYTKPSFGNIKFEQNNPVNISVAQVGINLDISTGKTNGDLWDISQTGASYLLGSGRPGESGNMIIYGHNKNQLLGPIRWLEKGAEIMIRDTGGKVTKYQVVETKIVSLNETEILSPTSDSTLTLYTCDGIGDSLRFVVVAKLTL